MAGGDKLSCHASYKAQRIRRLVEKCFWVKSSVGAGSILTTGKHNNEVNLKGRICISEVYQQGGMSYIP